MKRPVHNWFLKALTVVGALLACNVSLAQTGNSGAETGSVTDFTNSVFGIGANFSALSGAGISMRHHLPGKFSYMLSGYVFKAKQDVSYDYGIELQYDLIAKNRIRFYLMAGASKWYEADRSVPNYQNQYDGPERLGGGVGIETNLIGEDLCISVNASLTSFQPVGDLLILPYGGLHFYFR